ncbi:hypothetical protein VspSw1_110 [Vibrio phage VspSw_1]|uniref:Uncharacterized protein n=1 Tax=Vibrio phage VspSw_1 TaxID=2484249 RepID=A0A411BKR8_9CAUD|nr:hypothetical protein HOV08_gp110 [Vibrio phage VspSw_1]QAY02178.1 hypothetical protein VspSw1_110 [Vibrio phage VspSw_1]
MITSSLGLKISLGLLLVASATAGWFALQHSRAETALAEKTAKIESLQLDLSAANQALVQAKSRENRLYDLQVDYENQLSDLRKSLVQKNEEINQYKGRQDVVYAKPGLVERLEQKALDKFFTEVENAN